MIESHTSLIVLNIEIEQKENSSRPLSLKAIETKMWIKFSLYWDIDKALKLNKEVPSAVQLILWDIADIVQNSAKINAPYDSWNLQWSITTQRERIKQWIVVVWSPVAYARRREFENYKNPHRKFYLQRWYTENIAEIDRIIKNDLSQELK